MLRRTIVPSLHIRWIKLVLGLCTPISPICQFSWCTQPEYPEREKTHRPAANHLQTLWHNVVSITPRLSEIRTHNVSGHRHWLHSESNFVWSTLPNKPNSKLVLHYFVWSTLPNKPNSKLVLHYFVWSTLPNKPNSKLVLHYFATTGIWIPCNIYEIWIKWLNPKLHILFGNQTSPERRVWRYQRGNQNPYIEKEQTTQWPKEIVQREKQRSTKHTYKTKDRVTRTPLRTDWTHVLRKSKQFLLH
jgi:hypothetical protein